jgi:hypothetical protein
MTSKILFLISLFGILASTELSAQDTKQINQDIEKIRGTRFIPYPNYSGKPYLNDKFVLGEIEFVDKTKIDNVGLSYSTYRDELIYYNTAISAQILIDKISINGFSFDDKNGKKRIFRRMQRAGSLADESYFEILSEGEISLLVYRKVNLEPCDTYYSKSGLAYQPAYAYYLYDKDKGFSPLSLNRNSLLSKFNKSDQKLVRKLLRKNGVFVSDETSFILAWNLIKEKGISVNF